LALPQEVVDYLDRLRATGVPGAIVELDTVVCGPVADVDDVGAAGTRSTAGPGEAVHSVSRRPR
jgi:hypothetical protein